MPELMPKRPNFIPEFPSAGSDRGASRYPRSTRQHAERIGEVSGSGSDIPPRAIAIARCRSHPNASFGMILDEGGLPALADDLGLVVPHPEDLVFVLGRSRQGFPPRDGRRCSASLAAAIAAWCSWPIALGWPDEHIELSRGEVAGRLVWRGERGLGYDPMFVPEGGGHR
jgi:hypothetical protein